MRARRWKLVFVFAFSLLCVFAHRTPAAAQGSNGYSYSRAILIDHTKVPNSDQTNFPVLVSGTYSYLATTGNGGNVTSANGYDIIFTSDAAGTNTLPFEQENYSATTGAVLYWVQVPTLSHTVDSVIYVFYGNSSITTDQSNKNGTWDSSYKGVWHLANGTTLSATDSTSNSGNGTINSATATTGQIDGGGSFNGSTAYISGSGPNLDNSAFTISVWQKPSSYTSNRQFFSIGSSCGSDTAIHLRLTSNTTVHFGMYNDDLDVTVANMANAWNYTVVTLNGSKVQSIYENGSLAGSRTASNMFSGSTNWNIGRWVCGSSEYYSGTIDEVRISNTARSADWIATEYNNQAAPSSFYSIGAANTSGPIISSLSPISGPVSTSVTISGTNFGSTIGSSTLTFNGTSATPTTWGATSIVVPVPTGATTGNIVVTTSGVTSNNATFTVNSLVSGWLDQDIGSVGVAGSASYSSGTFTVQGAGSDIYGTADSFHFAYLPLSGDGTIVARVASLSGGGGNAKAGVMIRDTLSTGSANAFAAKQGTGTTLIFDYRTATGGSTSQATATGSLPYWVKVVRSGNSLSGYVASDGVNWTQLGTTQTISMATNIYFGLAVTGNSTSALATATFDNVSVSSTAAPAPVISSVSPGSGLVGTQVVISGSGFGATQGNSLVTLNNTQATINSWSATSITMTVPTGATSGRLVVSVAPSMNDSNPFWFPVLPTGWLDQDIGTVGLAGSANYSGGVFTVNGSGGGIQGTADGFHFVYQPLSGDGTITARVVSIGTNATYADAGVMIRETLTPGSEMGAVASQDHADYLWFRYRTTTGGSASGPNINMHLPYWVQLVRSGSTFTAYTALDGVNWTQIGSAQTISMATNVYVGLAVTTENTSLLVAATFDNVSINSTAAPAPIISSISGTTGSVGSQVQIIGSNFGATQNGSLVMLNDAPVTINSWSNTSITVTIPTGATSGYMAVSVAPSMNNSNAVPFEVTSNPLPITWLDQDVGTVGLAGSATYSSSTGIFTVNGSGSGIQSTADGFHFVYQPLSGDGTITARVVSIGTNATYADAGVMIRETLTPGSKMGAVASQDHADYLWFRYRTTTGGSASGPNINMHLPYWVQLVRSGSTFTAYTAPDGVNWTQIGSAQTISMATNVYVGLAVTTENTSLLVAATFDNVSINSTAAPAPIISSISGTTGSVGSQVVISGSNFGATQNGSLVMLNDAPVTINSWSSSSIAITIPTGATSGYMAVSVAPTMNDSNAVPFEVTSSPLPISWLDQDVGTVGLAGSASYSGGTFTVNGAGGGVQGTADGFHFVYQPLSGDGTITARVVSIGTNAAYGDAGVMIRETLTPGSKMAYVHSQDHQDYMWFRYRTTTGGTVGLNFINQHLPYWVKLIRSGSTFTAYTAPDGVNWTQLSSAETISMASSVYVGLAVTSESTSTLVAATFDNVTVTPSGTPPSVVISSLTPAAAPIGGTITISGSGFGSTQNDSIVEFNGVATSVSSWSSTSITATVPSGATSGPVTVTVGSVVSNSVSFSVIEGATVTGISPTSGPVGTSVTITGTGFGPTQSNSAVYFYGAAATSITSWSDTSITAVVPSGASSGEVSATVAGNTAYGPNFTLTFTVTVTDSLSNSSTYVSELVGGQWEFTDSDGSGCSTCTARGVIHNTYDGWGNTLTTTDALGNVTTNTYDTSNNLLSQTVPVDSTHTAVTTYTYNSFGEVLTVTDPLGHVTTNAYDTHGNLTSVTSPAPGGGPAASVTQFTYNSLGELTQITDPLSHATTMTYTTAGLIATITDAQSHVTTYGYDAHGNRTSVTDALSHQTTFAYDAGDRLTTITYPDSTTTSFTYDIRGRRTSVTDQNGKTTSYAYDDADRLTSVTDAASNVTSYAYDTEDNLVTLTDANTHSTFFTYDAFGRVTNTNFPSSQSETYAYDADNNLTSKTDRNGHTITYLYDALNRLTSKTYPDTTAVDYVYDLVGKITQVNDPTGTYAFAYDNMGRLIGTTTSYSFLTGRNFTNSYGYDAASNRTGYTDPEGGSTTYAYDTLNRLTTLAPPSAFGSGSFGFSYDALSRRTQMTRPNNVTTNYTYDNLSRLLSVLHQLSGSTIDGASYALDNGGNRTAKTDQLAAVTSNYGYDALYQLTQVTQGATTTESYSYDPVGNRLASLGVSSYTTNNSNELTATPTASYTYDSNGNTLTKVISSNTTTYAWDYENRLTSVTLPSSGGTVTFKYDPFGRRIEKISPTFTSIFAYDGDNLIEETNSSGTVVARYEQTQNIDEPLAMLRSSATSYYEADGLGSVTSLSNGAGALAQTYSFDSFGNTTPTGSLVNPFQYTGRELDSETGLYFDRTRYYDPNVGRFLSEDTIQFEGGNNFYAYVENNPVIWNDPFGRAHCTYNIASHQFHCTSDDGTQTFDTIRVRSGVGPTCMNIPTCANVPNKGPIPPGQYSMGRLGGTPNPHKIPRVYLTPKAGTNTFGRSAFEVHPGGDNSSEGCITLDFDEYDKWRRFYSRDNHGDLKVQ